MVRVRTTEKATSEQIFEDKGEHGNIQGKNFPSKETGTPKKSEIGTCMTHSKNSKEPMMTGTNGMKGKVVGDDEREVNLDKLSTHIVQCEDFAFTMSVLGDQPLEGFEERSDTKDHDGYHIWANRL